MREEKRISIVEDDAVTRQATKRKRSGRRYEKRLFASVGFVGRIRRTLLMFFALAILTFALCMLAPGNRNFKGQQGIQSSRPNNSDSVMKN